MTSTTKFDSPAEVAQADRELKECLRLVRGYVQEQGMNGWQQSIAEVLAALRINRTMVATPDYVREPGNETTGSLFVQGLPGQTQAGPAQVRTCVAMMLAQHPERYPLGVQVADMSGLTPNEATRYTRQPV